MKQFHYNHKLHLGQRRDGKLHLLVLVVGKTFVGTCRAKVFRERMRLTTTAARAIFPLNALVGSMDIVWLQRLV